METTLLLIAACLLIGGTAALFAFKPQWVPVAKNAAALNPIPDPFDPNHRSRKDFSLSNTLLIIGPATNHPACRLQRKLLKPAIPLLIREDIAVIELYGENYPRKNGDAIGWLDPALLRHALDAEEGFYIIYVDETGKTIFQNRAPMLTEMIAERANLPLAHYTENTAHTPKSAIAQRLQTI